MSTQTIQKDDSILKFATLIFYSYQETYYDAEIREKARSVLVRQEGKPPTQQQQVNR